MANIKQSGFTPGCSGWSSRHQICTSTVSTQWDLSNGTSLSRIGLILVEIWARIGLKMFYINRSRSPRATWITANIPSHSGLFLLGLGASRHGFDPIYSYYKLRSIFGDYFQIFRTSIELNMNRFKWPILSNLASLLVVLGEVPDTKFVPLQLVLNEIYPMVPVLVG